MSDITTVWDIAGARGDWKVSGASLLSGSDLETSVLISLFTDRQARDSDVIPDGTTDPRGWWGDLGQDKQIGSRLWLLERSKLSLQTGFAAKDYIAEALQWLKDDGVVAKIDIVTEVTLPNRLDAMITFYRQDGSSIAKNYTWVWQGMS